MEINTSILEAVFSRIVEKLKTEKVDEISLPGDAYRFIPSENWDDFEKDVIEIGSLFDDAAGLRMLATDDNRPCTYVDFERMASILRAISLVQNPI